MEKLNELFAIPKNAVPRGKIGDRDVYGSTELDYNFVNAMRENFLVEPVWKNIQKMVKKKTILPCYLTKGYFSFFVNKVFSPHQESDTLGFFSPANIRVYILVDNWSGLFGSANDTNIARTMLHEVVHLYAYTKPNDFLSLFKNELTTYYKNVFNFYFDVKTKITDKESQKIYLHLFKEYEISTSTSINLGKTRQLFYSIFKDNTKLNDSDFQKRIAIIIICMKLLATDFSLLRQYYYTTLIDVPRSLYLAYKDTFGFKPDGTLVIQEIFYPSEVICLLPSHGTKGDLTKVYNAIKKL